MCTDAGHFTKQVTCTECGLGALRTSIQRERERTALVEFTWGRRAWAEGPTIFLFLSSLAKFFLSLSLFLALETHTQRLKWHFAKFAVEIDFGNNCSRSIFDIWEDIFFHLFIHAIHLVSEKNVAFKVKQEAQGGEEWDVEKERESWVHKIRVKCNRIHLCYRV